jgi:zinc transport system substrate-binding protein
MARSINGMAVAALVLGLCASTGSPASAQVKVVVTSKPIHALVAGVMAGAGAPRLLIDGNASPHTYALKPSDAKALNEADVVFRVSDALEPFTAKVFKSLPKKVKAVTLAETPGLTLLKRRQGGPFEAHSHGKKGHDHGPGHKHGKDEDGGTDPHVWLDPSNAKAIAQQIASILSAASPGDAATFKANADKLGSRLDALAAELDRELKPLAGKPFIVFHDSLQYLEARFGLSAAGSIMVDPDDKPSARRLSDLRKKVAQLGAVCVLGEPQFPAKLVDSVTEGSKARTAIVDPEGGTLTAGPELYFELMRKAAAALKSCLQ